jgi:hypothetical protein
MMINCECTFYVCEMIDEWMEQKLVPYLLSLDMLDSLLYHVEFNHLQRRKYT